MSLSVKATAKESNKHGCSVSCVVSHNDYVVTGSDDGKIKVWKPDLELVSEMEAAAGILSLAACDDVLYSCSADEVIQSWDLKTAKNTGKMSTTLYQPQRVCVDKATKMLWAGDNQGNVARIENGRESAKYELVEEIWDLMVCSNPNLIYTARDRDVVVCEVIVGSSGTRVFTKATLPGRSPFCVAGHRLCFLSRDGRNIIVHENRVEKKFAKITEITASELIINAMASAADDIIYSGGYDSTVKKWDLNTSNCLGSVNLNCCINAIASRSENEVFIGRLDGSVTLIGA